MSTEKSVSDIGIRFIFVREQIAKANQTDFGAAIGIAQNTLSDIENGKRPPKRAVIKSLAYQYSISERWLLTGEGEMFATREPLRPPGPIKVGLDKIRSVLKNPESPYQAMGFLDDSPKEPEEERSPCCIPTGKRVLLEAALEVLNSGTIHAKALEQNILAFAHAVKMEKDHAETQIKMKEINGRLGMVEEEIKKRDQAPKPPAGSSGEEAI